MSEIVDTDPWDALGTALPGSARRVSGIGYVAEIPEVQMWLTHGCGDDPMAWVADLEVIRDGQTPFKSRADGETTDSALIALGVNARAKAEVEEMEALERYQQAKETRERVAKLFP